MKIVTKLGMSISGSAASTSRFRGFLYLCYICSILLVVSGCETATIQSYDTSEKAVNVRITAAPQAATVSTIAEFGFECVKESAEDAIEGWRRYIGNWDLSARTTASELSVKIFWKDPVGESDSRYCGKALSKDEISVSSERASVRVGKDQIIKALDDCLLLLGSFGYVALGAKVKLYLVPSAVINGANYSVLDAPITQLVSVRVVNHYDNIVGDLAIGFLEWLVEMFKDLFDFTQNPFWRLIGEIIFALSTLQCTAVAVGSRSIDAGIIMLVGLVYLDTLKVRK